MLEITVNDPERLALHMERVLDDPQGEEQLLGVEINDFGRSLMPTEFVIGALDSSKSPF